MDAEQSITLKLTLEEFTLIEELLQDYANTLRHEARLDLDLTGDQENAQRHMKEASEMERLREKLLHIQGAVD
ncbi:MAG TPA: hypothetical protein VIG82_08600 [Enteractinococcus sp.]